MSEIKEKMSAEDIAKSLDGREYPLNLSRLDIHRAKSAGLVILRGASDDLAELDGAISDETDVYETNILKIDKKGFVPDREQIDDDDDAIIEWADRVRNCMEINVKVFEDDITFQYETDIPHTTFKVVEDDDVYCIGIVFSVEDLP